MSIIHAILIAILGIKAYPEYAVWFYIYAGVTYVFAFFYHKWLSSSFDLVLKKFKEQQDSEKVAIETLSNASETLNASREQMNAVTVALENSNDIMQRRINQIEEERIGRHSNSNIH